MSTEPVITIETLRASYIAHKLSQVALHKRHAQEVMQMLDEAAKRGSKGVMLDLKKRDEWVYLCCDYTSLEKALGPDIQVSRKSQNSLYVFWEQ